MERNLNIFTVLRVLFTFAICAYHSRTANKFLSNDVFLAKIFEKFYLAVEGHFVISGWLNA